MIAESVCVCGAKLRGKQHICSECAEIYGTSPSDWPSWFANEYGDLHKFDFDSENDFEDEESDEFDEDDFDDEY